MHGSSDNNKDIKESTFK